MIVTKPRRRTSKATIQAGPDPERAIRDYVRAYVWRHGRRKTAEVLGVSRHTLWRFLERGHMGQAVPSAVLSSVGGNVRAIENARQQLLIDLMGHRPDPALPPLRAGLEEALLLLCAAPLTTVDELSRLGRVPASTLRERLEKLAKRGLVDSAPHHLSILGTRPQRRYFPTEQGVIAGGVATKGRAHMLRAYPVSKQWFRLLAERLDAVAVLYHVAAMVADADTHSDPVRADHYRKGPYDMLLILPGGRSIGLIRQWPTLSTANLRYRLRSIERLDSSETPFVTLVLTHADQATRRAMIDREEPKLSLVRQRALLGISRSSLYYLPTEAGAEDLELMALIDQQYLKTPFYGSRRMTAWLRNHGHQVNRKRVRRLMQLIGLEAIYRRPNTSKPNPGHKVYPYLLRGLEINRVNQVWATDITYIPMARGFLYLVAIMDWHSRYVLAWRLSNTLEVDFCVAALEEALSKGRPQIFNTDQGSQFTSEAFTSMLRCKAFK